MYRNMLLYDGLVRFVFGASLLLVVEVWLAT